MARRFGWLSGRYRTLLSVLVGYGALSAAFFGTQILRAPGHAAIGSGKYPDDPSLFMWMLAWWPHALGHGLHPLITRLLFAPDGFNLTWTTSIPGPSLAVAPITVLAGPAVAYNVLALLAPALNGFTAFLLCRHVTGRVLPSIAGGYVFGFSSYVLGALEGGHVHLSLVALLPLCVLLVLRHLDGSLGSRRFVALLAAVLAAQFLISTEVLLTLTMIGGLALAVALIRPEQRGRILRTGRLIALAYAGMAVVVSPLIYYMLFKAGTQPHVSPQVYSSDLANFVIPTALTRVGGGHFHSISRDFSGNLSEQGAYVGLPLLVIVGMFAATRRKHAGDWVLVACFAASGVLALGPLLHVGGTWTGANMPWEPLTHLPLVRHAIPDRMVAYAFLAAALIVALWLARRPSLGRWLLAALAIVALVPNRDLRQYHESYSPPRFITQGAYKQWLHPRDRVLVLPFRGGRPMRWQAQAEMRFALVGGYAQHLPRSYRRWPIVAALESNAPGRGAEAELAPFLAAKRVTAIVVDERRRGRWPRILERLRLSPTHVSGVLLYRLPRQ
ncbi:MAG: hypothetical protein QOK04_1825 [Solirubrobacteraceae bacterium]|jgi:hypothetical protein|nr:hypothetical protein [Solirubrobacteraceae bacterium]